MMSKVTAAAPTAMTPNVINDPFMGDDPDSLCSLLQAFRPQILPTSGTSRAPESVTVRDGGITELTATRRFGAGVNPMLVKDEIRPLCNLPPDGNSTRNAALQDILPFDEHIGFE